MGKTLDIKINISRKEAELFLEQIAPGYRTFAGFQDFVENYEGALKTFLLKVERYIGNQNKKGSRIYGLGESEIKDILNATLPGRP